MESSEALLKETLPKETLPEEALPWETLLDALRSVPSDAFAPDTLPANTDTLPAEPLRVGGSEGALPMPCIGRADAGAEGGPLTRFETPSNIVMLLFPLA